VGSADFRASSAGIDNESVTQGNVEAVRRQHERFNETGELAVEIYDPDFEWQAAREDPDAAVHRGIEAVSAYFRQWTEMFPGIRIEALELVEAADHVFAWIRITGRGRDSGLEIDMEQAQVWTFRGGKAVRVEEYFDRSEGLAAAGLENG
jgi:ketosteroid isomerase-like protein